MKLDLDCVREVLLAVESLEYDVSTTPEKLHDMLPDYSVEQLEYTCLMLGDGGYLELMTVQLPMKNTPSISSILSLTFKGHEFISDIRKSDIWSGIKNVAARVGTTSLSGIAQISANVITEIIKSQFDL